MHDQPEPTPEEQDEPPERLREEDAMRQAGHDDPKGRTEPQGDDEIHDA